MSGPDGDPEVHDLPDDEWRSLHAHLYANFRRAGAGREEAEDLTQEAMARIFAKPRRFPLPQMLTSFAVKVGKNLWIDRIRRTKRRAGHDLVQAPSEAGVEALLATAAGAGPDAQATSREDVLRLLAALEDLLPIHRDVLDLVIFGGVDYEEAARRLGVPRGTIKSRVHYAIADLRRRLAERDPDRAVSEEDSA